MMTTQDSQKRLVPLRCRWLVWPLIVLLPYSLTAAMPDIFARFSTDRNGIFAGEQFQLTLTLHITGDTLGKQVSISGLPPSDQLSLTPFQELSIGTVTLEGRSYETRPFRCQARALAAKNIVLAPSLQGTLDQITRSYFFIQHNQRPVSIPIEPLTLAILAVPEAGRPGNFSGAVGRFSFQVSAAPLDVAVGDLVTVTLRIVGAGLPEAFTPPFVPEAPGFKNYAVQRVPEDSSDAQRVFRQTVVPLESTARAIPAISFTTFDARANRYRTQTAGPFPLTFHPERAPVQPIYSPSPSVTTPSAASPAVPFPSPRQVGWSERMKNKLLARNLSVIVGAAEVTIRFAPSESARPLFTLKPGTTVSVQSTAGGWARLSCREGIGWVQETNVESDDK